MKLLPLLFLLTLSFPVLSQEYVTDTLRIFYPIDVVSLDKTSVNKLDSLASLVKRNKKARLSITGYADYLGTNPHNIDLSVRRSAITKESLIQKGLDSLQIMYCEGKGALQPFDIKGDQRGIPFHRRTDIVVTWPVKKKTPPEKDELALNLKNVKKGDHIVLKNLNFEGGEHLLLPESFSVLQELTQIMKSNPGLKIEIQGHICCDSVSDDGYDAGTGKRDLSYQRAKVIYNHLVHMGIDSTRLMYKGYGGKYRLIKDERTETDRRRNRRVEVRILER
jgi:outer membrane protein OmpA-like peptidoglycan-associated protein